MGISVETDDLDELCAMMCDNRLPRRKKMKKQVLLTDEDILQTIANSFNVSKDAVRLETYKDTVGCGQGERDIFRTRATVELPMNDGR